MPKHRRLEWWRHAGLDVARGRPALQLCFLVSQGACLAVMATLSSNAVRRTGAWFGGGDWDPIPIATGADENSTTTMTTGPVQSEIAHAAGTCERADPATYVEQPALALAAWCFVAMGVAVVFLGVCDAMVAWRRHRALDGGMDPGLVPYSLGPGGEGHVRVTALASYERGDQPHFEGVDPEYLRGNHPSLMRREPAWSFAVAVCVTFLGVAKFMFHVTLAPLGLRLASFAYFCVHSCVAAYIGARMLDGLANAPTVNLCCLFGSCGVSCNVRCDQHARRRSSSVLTVAGLLISAGADAGAWVWMVALGRYELPLPLFAVMALGCAVGLYVHYWARHREVDTFWSFGVLGVFVFTGGWMFLVYESVLCVGPTSAFQPRAVWVVGQSLSLTCLYLMLRGDTWRYDTIYASEYVDPHRREDAYRIPSGVLGSNNTPSKRGSRPSGSGVAGGGGAFEVNMDSVRDSVAARSSRRGMSSSAAQPTPGGGGGSGGAAASGDGLYAHSGKRASDSSQGELSLVAGRRLKVRSEGKPRVPSLERPLSPITGSDGGGGGGGLKRVESVASHGSAGSGRNSARLDALRAQAAARPIPQQVGVTRKLSKDDRGSVTGSVHSAHSGNSSVAFWTCPSCGYLDNEMNWVVCERCEAKRPKELVQQSELL